MPLSFIFFQLLKALIGRFQVILFIYLKCILLILTQKHVFNKALMTRCLRTHPFANIPFLCGKKRVKSQHLAKSQDFWVAVFFLKLWKSRGWYGFSYGILVVLNVYFINVCLKLLLILNFTSCFISSEAFLYKRMVSSAPKKSIDRLGFKNLYPREKPMPVTRLLLTKSRDFRQNFLSDFHLFS